MLRQQINPRWKKSELMERHGLIISCARIFCWR
jgi:hypothetical protein